MIFINKIREVINEYYNDTPDEFEYYVKDILISVFIKLNIEDINILLTMLLLLMFREFIKTFYLAFTAAMPSFIKTTLY